MHTQSTTRRVVHAARCSVRRLDDGRIEVPWDGEVTMHAARTMSDDDTWTALHSTLRLGPAQLAWIAERLDRDEWTFSGRDHRVVFAGAAKAQLLDGLRALGALSA